MTCTRRSIAYEIASASVSVLQVPGKAAVSCQQALSTERRTSGATPTMPRRLSPVAAIAPATAVPWRSPRKRAASASTKLAACWIRGARSGWVVSTPVSITATWTARPVAIRCAYGKRIAGSACCSG